MLASDFSTTKRNHRARLAPQAPIQLGGSEPAPAGVNLLVPHAHTRRRGASARSTYTGGTRAIAPLAKPLLRPSECATSPQWSNNATTQAISAMEYKPAVAAVSARGCERAHEREVESRRLKRPTTGLFIDGRRQQTLQLLGRQLAKLPATETAFHRDGAEVRTLHATEQRALTLE